MYIDYCTDTSTYMMLMPPLPLPLHTATAAASPVAVPALAVWSHPAARKALAALHSTPPHSTAHCDCTRAGGGPQQDEPSLLGKAKHPPAIAVSCRPSQARERCKPAPTLQTRPVVRNLTGAPLEPCSRDEQIVVQR
ncbi:hypothetical protein GRF29_8g1900825 [Pseudopithomyces chartarum]|uniref:Uncharacterized protein n=1 Tax=Pseudopithomyces chartarum TaxID=1892770 RepID=A0AAN6M593_9PLEO|nr:hypothetical protein GRF29_8g1900825 [Pseudopithomyces chartarum]